MKVSLRLFAVAREKVGTDSLALDVPESATVADLRAALAAARPELAPLLPSTWIAVDSEYAGDDQPIRPDSEIALIPPVSGGRPRQPEDPRNLEGPA